MEDACGAAVTAAIEKTLATVRWGCKAQFQAQRMLRIAAPERIVLDWCRAIWSPLRFTAACRHKPTVELGDIQGLSYVPRAPVCTTTTIIAEYIINSICWWLGRYGPSVRRNTAKHRCSNTGRVICCMLHIHIIPAGKSHAHVSVSGSRFLRV